MATISEIEEKAKVVLSSELKVGLQELQPEKRIAEDLGADSLQRIELVMKLEEAFEVKIPDDEAIQLVTVGEVINYLQQRCSSNSNPG